MRPPKVGPYHPHRDHPTPLTPAPPPRRRRPLSAARGYRYGKWHLLFNEREAALADKPYDACRINEYAEHSHPLYSYAYGSGRRGAKRG